jgi:hypothetical protein
MPYVEIPKDHRALQMYLAEVNGAQDLNLAQGGDSVQAANSVLESLENLERSELNRPEAGVSFIFRSTHIQLREGIWEFLILAGHLAIDHNLIGQALTAAEAIRKAVSIVTTLDPTELMVASASLRVVGRKSEDGRILEIKEAAIQEIEEELRKAKLPPPPNIENILDHLCPRVIEKVFHEGRGPYYKVVF